MLRSPSKGFNLTAKNWYQYRVRFIIFQFQTLSNLPNVHVKKINRDVDVEAQVIDCR